MYSKPNGRLLLTMGLCVGLGCSDGGTAPAPPAAADTEKPPADVTRSTDTMDSADSRAAVDSRTPPPDTLQPPDATSADGMDSGERALDVPKPDVPGDCGGACDDGDPCNGTETCDRARQTCQAGEPILCDDGQACNGVESCDSASGDCVAGKPLCDDGLPCNGQEGCDEATGACTAGIYIQCSDGDACNGEETCDALTGDCVPGENPNCDDGDSCTLDACDPDVGCTVTPVCDDGDPCTEDLCDPVLNFCDAKVKACEATEPCAIGSCNPESGACEYSVVSKGHPTCDDQNPCTHDICEVSCAGENCQEVCTSQAVECVDANACTLGSCDPLTGLCEWEDVVCPGAAPCLEVGCLPEKGCWHAPKDCDDGQVCTQDSCDPAQGCIHELVAESAALCDDGVPCTIDACVAESGCEHAAKSCDDGVDCTEDSCEPVTGTCLHDASAAGCEDGDLCTDDACDEQGGCTHTAKDCNDNDPCTVETCDPATGLCVVGDVSCDDGVFCNGQESCDPSTGLCVAGASVQCSDGNACNGFESCSESAQACTAGTPLTCNDGDGCNGTESCIPATGQCLSASLPGCPSAPPACGQAGGSDGPSDGYLTTSPPAAFGLVDQDTWASQDALWDDLSSHHSVQPAALSSILFNELNRTGTPITVSGIGCFDGGFKWNEGDNKVDYWWPQGVGSSAAAYGGAGQTGTVDGRDVLLVAWYHKAEEDSSTSQYKGVRISITDITYSNDIRYRHALLVEPTVNAQGQMDYKPLATATSSNHAGGIVWIGNLLYVADTSKGFRVFDMSRILRVQTGQKNTCGYDPGTDAYYAYNYLFVIPQIGRYTLCGQSCCARFSFASLDRTTTPPTILAGEYDSSTTRARLHRWPLDATTGRLAVQDGAVLSTQILFPGVKKLQGALSVGGDYFFSSSATKLSWPPSPGTLYHGTVGGAMKDWTFPSLPEDLTYDRFEQQLWTCTEKPASWLGSTRYCFRFSRQDVISGCD